MIRPSSATPSSPRRANAYIVRFYFIDELFGLCFVRGPTWAPFRLQVYFNGHDWLARHLDKAGIG